MVDWGVAPVAALVRRGLPLGPPIPAGASFTTRGTPRRVPPPWARTVSLVPMRTPKRSSSMSRLFSRAMRDGVFEREVELAVADEIADAGRIEHHGLGYGARPELVTREARIDGDLRRAVRLGRCLSKDDGWNRETAKEDSYGAGRRALFHYFVSLPVFADDLILETPGWGDGRTGSAQPSIKDDRREAVVTAIVPQIKRENRRSRSTPGLISVR